MSISTFNFQFYNYKLPAAMPQFTSAASFSELEMDIDEEELEQPQPEQEMSKPAITSTPLPTVKQPLVLSTPRYTSELSLAISTPDVSNSRPSDALRPQLHRPQKRWSMELREKVLEMSKRNNASDEAEQQQKTGTGNLQQRFMQQLEADSSATEISRTVSDKINFFNKLTNTYESARNSNNNNNNNNRFISLLRATRSMDVATTGGAGHGPVPPPKPKRLIATNSTTATAPATTTTSVPHQFATPNAKATQAYNNNVTQRKSSLRRKPSMEKSRATIARQNSSATLRPQRHALMEDLSLVVPVRLRIAEYEQRISMSA
ncbi:GH13977 [Drosophila grimshawi]|uniref:GH13977 n=1 Tax=Drosophila grimshawi TaxID=7222 RepID=B4JYP8_DROGR|nr:GH13977 [Drosophila grimshawi]